MREGHGWSKTYLQVHCKFSIDFESELDYCSITTHQDTNNKQKHSAAHKSYGKTHVSLLSDGVKSDRLESEVFGFRDEGRRPPK